MVKSLRSAQYSTDQIFALCRLANNLEDPPRSKVRSLLKKAIQFKGAMLPCRAKALLIPVLARSSFSTQVRSWLKNIVIERKDFLTPFHLPVCSVIPGRFPTIENKLYSHFGWMKKFSWDHPPQCLPDFHLPLVFYLLSVLVLLGEEAYASQRPSLEAWLRLAPKAPRLDPPESSAEAAEADSGTAEEPVLEPEEDQRQTWLLLQAMPMQQLLLLQRTPGAEVFLETTCVRSCSSRKNERQQ
eukprot:s1307_g4.t1